MNLQCRLTGSYCILRINSSLYTLLKVRSSHKLLDPFNLTSMIIVQDYGDKNIKELNDEERLAMKLARTHLRTERRKIRYRLFRIRDAVMRGVDPDPEHDKGLRAWMEIQFQPGMSWGRKSKESGGDAVGGFTFEWDIACNEPLKVIRQFAWDGESEARPVAEMVNGKPTGRTVTVDVCDPAAFTQQG